MTQITEPSETRFVESFDGTRLAWREMGEGRPVLLLHGFVSDAYTNWIRYGHAAAIAANGRRVVMPDLRAHGESEKPHDPAAYPPDVLALDGHWLIERLGLVDYDLGGYSLGARTAVRMLVTGARPRRVVLSGMGLEGMLHPAGRVGFFRRALSGLGEFDRGSPEWFVEAFVKTTGGDQVALLHILDTFVETPIEALRAISSPTLIATGIDDRDNGSAEDVVATLPDAAYAPLPGNHMSAVVKPELGRAFADFLGA